MASKLLHGSGFLKAFTFFLAHIKKIIIFLDLDFETLMERLYPMFGAKVNPYHVLHWLYWLCPLHTTDIQ